MDKVQLTDGEWQQRLTPEEYRVLRQAGTQAPFTGESTDTKTEGVYRCRAVGAPGAPQGPGKAPGGGDAIRVPGPGHWAISGWSAPAPRLAGQRVEEQRRVALAVEVEHRQDRPGRGVHRAVAHGRDAPVELDELHHRTLVDQGVVHEVPLRER